MKNLTNYLLAAALLASPALLAQAAEEQPVAEPQFVAQQQEQQPAENQQELDEPTPEPEAPTPTGTEEQTEPTGEMPAQAGTAGGSQFIEHESARQVLASNLMGYSVTNLQGENIGQVEDLILDQNLRPVGMVISTGGFLGLGAKHVALPMSEVQVNRENKVVQINLSKEELNKAPTFAAQKEEQNGRKEGGAGGASGQ